MGDPILAQLLEYLAAQQGSDPENKPWDDRLHPWDEDRTVPYPLWGNPQAPDTGWVDVPEPFRDYSDPSPDQPTLPSQPMPRPNNGPNSGQGIKIWEDGTVSFGGWWGASEEGEEPTKEEYFRERWLDEAPKRTDKKSSPKGANVVNPDLLAMLMEYILNRQTNGDASIGGDMPMDDYGLQGTIGGLGAVDPNVNSRNSLPLSFNDHYVADGSGGNRWGPNMIGGEAPPQPPRQQTLGELLALHGLYDPGPARPMPGRVDGPQPRPVAGAAGNAPAQSNKANTPPRTGVLPNGNAFPGQGRDNSRSFKPDPQARPATPRVPVGFQAPRNLPPSSPPAQARPASRPVPPRGISYPIQAAKRIQQAAARPQIAKPMSPGTLRSLTRR
jgi:hypothetical protein